MRPRNDFQVFSTAVQHWLEQIVRNEVARALAEKLGVKAPPLIELDAGVIEIERFFLGPRANLLRYRVGPSLRR
jgi:hypothetical protein